MVVNDKMPFILKKEYISDYYKIQFCNDCNWQEDKLNKGYDISNYGCCPEYGGENLSYKIGKYRYNHVLLCCSFYNEILEFIERRI